MLVEYYNTFLKFQDEQLTSNLVAQFIKVKGVPITLAISYRPKREILDRFPTEKLVCLVIFTHYALKRLSQNILFIF